MKFSHPSEGTVCFVFKLLQWIYSNQHLQTLNVCHVSHHVSLPPPHIYTVNSDLIGLIGVSIHNIHINVIRIYAVTRFHSRFFVCVVFDLCPLQGNQPRGGQEETSGGVGRVWRSVSAPAAPVLSAS